MIKLKTNRILIPVDFSETSRKAINHAASLAKLSSGELFLLYVRRKKNVLDLGYSTSELRIMASESANYKKLMEGTAREIRSKYCIRVKVLVALGGRISEIKKTAEKKNIGLIVMGTEGSDSTSSVFSGSNSHRVVSRSQIPVMTVRSSTRKEGYSTLLLPIDSSAHTRQKVNVAVQMAKMYGSTIHLLGLLNNKQGEYEGKLKTIMKQIEKYVKSEDLPVSSEIIKTNEPVKRTLSSAKRHKADMIITMTDQKTNTSPFASASYDRELVDGSRIPILSIPPEIHEENIEPASIGGLW